ncbi:hypothetical protein BSKO_03661 [Bryopsis sp. KO-2023]|nr:hypothetical protein BSKO_03661 [Bryopsis sp. KO-2023]
MGKYPLLACAFVCICTIGTVTVIIVKHKEKGCWCISENSVNGSCCSEDSTRCPGECLCPHQMASGTTYPICKPQTWNLRESSRYAVIYLLALTVSLSLLLVLTRILRWCEQGGGENGESGPRSVELEVKQCPPLYTVKLQE